MTPLEFLPGDSYQHFFEGAPVCPGCLAVTEPEWISPTFVLKGDRADAVYTRDGALVVTDRFKRHHLHDGGVRFLSLPADSRHFRMIVDPVVRVDLACEPPELVDRCATCGRASTYGSPTKLMTEDSMPKGFSRSDVEYGGLGGFVRSQHPAIFVDPSTAARLKRLHRCNARPIRSAPRRQQ